MKLYYDPLKKALINMDAKDNEWHIVYEEDGLGDINIEDVVQGREKFDDGREFTLEDFIMLELDIIDFELV